jgi:hypothetical protein
MFLERRLIAIRIKHLRNEVITLRRNAQDIHTVPLRHSVTWGSVYIGTAYCEPDVV